MSLKRVLYVLFILIIAGGSALVGAAAGGFAVYRAGQGQPNNLPAPIQDILPANNTNPGQTLTLNNTDVETAVTKSVQKVSPTVVTVVGTIPGQTTFFGNTGDQIYNEGHRLRKERASLVIHPLQRAQPRLGLAGTTRPCPAEDDDAVPRPALRAAQVGREDLLALLHDRAFLTLGLALGLALAAALALGLVHQLLLQVDQLQQFLVIKPQDAGHYRPSILRA